MDQSCRALQAASRPFPLPIAFYEWVSNSPPPENGSPLKTVLWIARGLRQTGVRRLPGRGSIRYVLQRFERERKETEQEEPNDKQQEFSKRLQSEDFKPQSFGELYLRWALKLDAWSTCLYLAGGDPLQADRLYYEVDREDLLSAFSVRVDHEMERINSTMEAAMYGFGGGYKTDKSRSSGAGSNDGPVYDLTTDEGRKAGLAILRQQGF